MKYIWEEKDIHVGRKLDDGEMTIGAKPGVGPCFCVVTSGYSIELNDGKFYTAKQIVDRLNSNKNEPYNIVKEMPF
jgi:hypothetical protein